MRTQSFALGLFFILMGIALYVYFALLPLSVKEQMLQEMYNITINPKENTSVSYKYLDFRNIEMSKDYSKYVIADKYIVGALYDSYEVYLPSIDSSTNVFRGNLQYTFSLYYNASEYKGIRIELNLMCKNAEVILSIGGYEVYKGCENRHLSLYVNPGVLSDQKNTLNVVIKPTNIFSNAEVNINAFKVVYLKSSELNYVFYYSGGEAELIYNFCPADPNALNLYIDGNRIPFTSCSGILKIDPYLKNGLNYIRISSNINTNISAYINIKNPIFYVIFNDSFSTIRIIKEYGEINIDINGICNYKLGEENISFIKDISNCLIKGSNVLVIKSLTNAKLINVWIE